MNESRCETGSCCAMCRCCFLPTSSAGEGALIDTCLLSTFIFCSRLAPVSFVKCPRIQPHHRNDRNTSKRSFRILSLGRGRHSLQQPQIPRCQTSQSTVSPFPSTSPLTCLLTAPSVARLVVAAAFLAHLIIHPAGRLWLYSEQEKIQERAETIRRLRVANEERRWRTRDNEVD